MTARLDDTRGITIVILPPDKSQDIIAVLYIFIYNIENFDNQRFFAIGKGPLLPDKQLLEDLYNKCYGEVDVELNDSETFLYELLPEGRIYYGSIELDIEKILDKISEIYAK